MNNKNTRRSTKAVKIKNNTAKKETSPRNILTFIITSLAISGGLVTILNQMIWHVGAEESLTVLLCHIVTALSGVLSIINTLIPDKRDPKGVRVSRNIFRAILTLGLIFSAIIIFTALISSDSYATMRLVILFYLLPLCGILATLFGFIKLVTVLKEMWSSGAIKKGYGKKIIIWTVGIVVCCIALIVRWSTFRASPTIEMAPVDTNGWSEYDVYSNVKIMLPDGVAISRDQRIDHGFDQHVSAIDLNDYDDINDRYRAIAFFSLEDDVNKMTGITNVRTGVVIVGTARFFTYVVDPSGGGYRAWYIPCGEKFLEMIRYTDTDTDSIGATMASTVTCE